VTRKVNEPVLHWHGGGVLRDARGGVMVYPAGTPLCGRRGDGTRFEERVSCSRCATLLREVVSGAEVLRTRAERARSGPDASVLLAPQPDPATGSGDVWAAVIAWTTDERLLALYRARREQGIARYGVPLQADNGRDHLVDALQELVDAVVYLAAAGLNGARIAERVEELILDVLREIEQRDGAGGGAGCVDAPA
jgi:hypothetical protein